MKSTKRTVGIASVPARKDALLTVVTSIKDQVDEIFIALNGYESVPEELYAVKNAKYAIFGGELGDAMKFYCVSDVEGYYFSCDDDLIYSKSYVTDMISAIDKHRCIITHHGKQFSKRPVHSYRRGWTKSVHCLHTSPHYIYADVGGTGVMGFHTDDFKLSIKDFTTKNMADIYCAKVAHAQGVKILVIPHKNDYFGYLAPVETIWNSFSGQNDKFQTEVLNSFLK